MEIKLTPVGVVHVGEEGCYIEIEPRYRPALLGLEGFGYIQVLWYCDGCDDQRSRDNLIEHQPYVKGPELLGVFATRSPQRPNPIALSAAYVTHIDERRGIIGLAWIDAREGTPVLDVKPYVPSLDRVEQADVPSWCAHWPDNVEGSGDFDWSREFNF